MPRSSATVRMSMKGPIAPRRLSIHASIRSVTVRSMACTKSGSLARSMYHCSMPRMSSTSSMSWTFPTDDRAGGMLAQLTAAFGHSRHPGRIRKVRPRMEGDVVDGGIAQGRRARLIVERARPFDVLDSPRVRERVVVFDACRQRQVRRRECAHVGAQALVDLLREERIAEGPGGHARLPGSPRKAFSRSVPAPGEVVAPPPPIMSGTRSYFPPSRPHATRSRDNSMVFLIPSPPPS